MIATAVVGAVGAGLGVAKYIDGKKMQSDAQGKIDDFEFDKLNNAYINNQVSTLGADLRREEAARVSASQINALQASGTRGLVGGLGRVTANNNQINREIAANLDEQQKAIDMAASADNANIRSMTEQRQNNELAGYGALLNTGMGMKYDGLTDVVNGIGTLGTSLKGMSIDKANAPQSDGYWDTQAYKDSLITNQLQGAEVNPANQTYLPQSFIPPYYSAGVGQYGMGYGQASGVDNFYNNLFKFKNRPY